MPITYTIDNTTRQVLFNNFYSNLPEYNVSPVVTMRINNSLDVEDIAAAHARISERAKYTLTQNRMATLLSNSYCSFTNLDAYLNEVSNVTNATEVARIAREAVVTLDEYSLEGMINILQGRFPQMPSSSMDVAFLMSRDSDEQDYALKMIAGNSQQQINYVEAHKTIANIRKLLAGEISELYFNWTRSTGSLFHDTVRAMTSLSRSYSNGDSRSKEQKLMYKLSHALKRDNNAKAATGLASIDSHRVIAHQAVAAWISNLSYGRSFAVTVKYKAKPVVVPSTESKVQKKVSLLLMHPELKNNLKNARSNLRESVKYIRNVFDRDNFDWSTLAKLFDWWNTIKVELMLFGYSEKKAAKFVTSVMLSSKSIKSLSDDDRRLVRCAFTDQLIPSLFATEVKLLSGEYAKVSLRYIGLVQSRNSSYGSTYDRKFAKKLDARAAESDTPKYVYVEQKVAENQVYFSDVFNYSLRTPQLLSPRSLPEENVMAIRKGNRFSPTPWMGIELEVERAADCPENITELVYNDLGRDFVMFKQDGSLRGHHPFEIVTVPATLAYHKQAWSKFMLNMEVKGKLQSYKSGRCGMHIHVSRDAFSGLHLAKFMRFINSTENRRFITSVAGRAENAYTRYEHIEKITDGTRNNMLHNGQRGAVNRNNTNTIEVRIFRGNLSKTAFFKNIEFVHAVWQYTKDCSTRELEYKEFLAWLFDPRNSHDKTYQNLQLWCVSSKFMVSNIVISRKATPEERKELLKKRKEINKIQLVVNRKYNTAMDKPTVRTGKACIEKQEIVANQ